MTLMTAIEMIAVEIKAIETISGVYQAPLTHCEHL